MKVATSILKTALLIVSTAFILAYLYAVYFRIGFPYELHWMEGASALHLRRVLVGESLYPKPSIEFVPFTYTPLYFYLSAVIAKFTGLSFFPLRLLSVLASMGCFLVIYLLVKHETKCASWGLIAAGFYAATYQASGFWFDIARVDSLLLFFLITAYYLVRIKESPVPYISAGILICLAFLTKQVSLVIAAPLLLYVLWHKRSKALYLIGPSAVLIILTILILNYKSGGWFYFYVFDSPRHRWLTHVTLQSFLKFWILDLLIPFIIALALAFVFLYKKAKEAKTFSFYGLLLIGFIGGACFGRSEFYNYYNTLMPAHIALAVVFTLGAHLVTKPYENADKKPASYLPLMILPLCLLQYLLFLYNPKSHTPTTMDLENGNKYIQRISEIEGEVYIPDHSLYPLMAGKKTFAPSTGIGDVLLGNDGEIRAALLTEIKRVIHQKKFSAIIIDSGVVFKKFFLADIKQHYTNNPEIFRKDGIYTPVAGYRITPDVWIVKKTKDTRASFNHHSSK